ncbi:MAG: autotransporter outer membrane beta-barrel domain-containing protein, partial [Candidatus Ratteibacteria bacterium]|nr:autotransporter outer membrane beta-barrel domain-containing protein [Candidatus Ratteibacteria bacterium]
KSAFSFGVCVGYEGKISELNNFGTISATAEAGESASSYGIRGENKGKISELNNFGTISATAEAGGNASSYGIREYEISELNNFGTISATAGSGGNAFSCGIWGENGGEISGLTNSGDITATTQAGAGKSARSYGIYGEKNSINGLDNSGNITATAEASGAEGYARSYGIYGYNNSINGLTNSGNITAIAEAEEGDAYSYGIRGSEISGLNNFGTISASVTLSGSTGTGKAVGISGSGVDIPIFEESTITNTITNEGLILVKGTVPEWDIEARDTSYSLSLAGIVITGGNVVISNPGEIRLESNIEGIDARALYIENGYVTIDDCFAVTLGSPGIGPEMAPIYVEDGTLDLNDATLIVRADSRNLQFDTPYPIIENYGTVNNVWADELEVGYKNKSIVVDWDTDARGEEAAVIFGYDPQEADPEDVLAPGMGGMTGTPVLISSIAQQINSYSPLNVNALLVEGQRQPVLLASSGVSDAGLPGLGATKEYRGVWFMPVYTRIVGDDIGYDANAYGLAIGIGGKVSDVGYVGGYAGYVRGDMDFDIDSGDTEDQNIFLGGLNLMYGPQPWYVRFSGVGYYADHDYDGYTGLSYELDEKASYNSIGCDVELVAGGNFGEGIRFVPEAGLAYQYSSTDSFKTKVSDDPTWERKIKPDDVSILKALAGMSVIGGVGSPTQYYFGVRLEYALSDNDVSAVNSLGGTAFDIEREMDDSIVVLQAGLNHDFENNWSLEFGLRGDLSDEYNAYTGRLFVRRSF